MHNLIDTNTHYLDNIQVKKHGDRSTNFMLKTMHLKAHTLEDHLSAGSERDLLQDSRNLRRVQTR